MRSKVFLLPLLLACCAAFPQSSKENSLPRRSVTPLARLSYAKTGAVQSGDPQGSPNICFMLEQNGHYRIEKKITKSGGTEISQGLLSADEVSRVSQLLKNVASAEPTTGGWVQRGAERFIAEIQQDDQTRRLRWIDPDHTRPFPESVTRIVNWLQDFKTESSSFSQTLPIPSVCPVWSEPLQPQSAKLERDHVL